MRSTRKALRATVTIAGVAALGASFAGTATAAENNDLFNTGDEYSSDSSSDDDYDYNSYDDDDSTGLLGDNGLAVFDLPTLQSSQRTSDSDGGLGLDLLHNDDEWDGDDRDDDGDWDGDDWDDDGDWDDEDSDSHELCESDDSENSDDDHGIQHPLQCEGNDFLGGDLQIAGIEL